VYVCVCGVRVFSGRDVLVVCCWCGGVVHNI